MRRNPAIEATVKEWFATEPDPDKPAKGFASAIREDLHDVIMSPVGTKYTTTKEELLAELICEAFSHVAAFLLDGKVKRHTSLPPSCFATCSGKATQGHFARRRTSSPAKPRNAFAWG